MRSYMLQVVCSIVIPICAYLLLRWAEDPSSPSWPGYVLVAGMALANALAVLFKEQFSARCDVLGSWAMAGVFGLAYRKCLRMSVADAFSSNIGQVRPHV